MTFSAISAVSASSSLGERMRGGTCADEHQDRNEALSSHGGSSIDCVPVVADAIFVIFVPFVSLWFRSFGRLLIQPRGAYNTGR